MKSIKLVGREQELANYLVDRNKATINRIPKDCISPLIAIRQSCKETADAIGKTSLISQASLTHEEWLRITRWIANTFFNNQ